MSKRNWLRLTPARGIALGVALSLVLTIGVGTLAYSLLQERNTEREEASAYDPSTAEIEAKCRYTTPFANTVECIRNETDAAREAKHNHADLHAQQDVAALTFGMFAFTGLSFLTGSWGLVALIWTFYEQRTFGQDQSRGFLEVIGGHVSEHSELGFRYRLTIKAYGDTPIFDIQFGGTLSIRNVVWRESKETRFYSLSASVDELAPQADWVLSSRAGKAPPTNEDGHWIGLKAMAFPNDGSGGTAALRYGAYISEIDAPDTDEHLSVIGRIDYKDAFGRKHHTDINQFMFIDFDGWLRGTGTQSPRFGSDDE